MGAWILQCNVGITERIWKIPFRLESIREFRNKYNRCFSQRKTYHRRVDIETAYDMVWKSRVISILKKYCFTENIYRKLVENQTNKNYSKQWNESRTCVIKSGELRGTTLSLTIFFLSLVNNVTESEAL